MIRRDAFTLIEVLLTLSLSVVLIILVGGAIQFYARTLTVQDMDIRQVQLAAAVMQMIEDDLRAAVHPKPIDTAALETLLASTATQEVGGAEPGGASSEEDLSAAGIDTGFEEEEEVTPVADAGLTDLQSGASVLQTPGLIGNQYQIQVDLSRLPRLEEYTVMMDATVGNLQDVPSDLKTVTYFVQQAGTIAGVIDPLDNMSNDPTAAPTESTGGGLVRRSLDRFATLEAINSGSMSMLNQTGELLAPEITSIEFAYWDGMMWLIEWNSDEYGELPMAVQVQMTMIDPTAALTDTSDLSSVDTTRVFTHIVRLPMARPIEESEEDLTGVGL
ncbi:prepilin-type cleavage/methylation domain-containing protein [Novipirellula artificiosorum]|uniref:Pseudopilin GspJ n=1 Tax=Novipirellula artificiosorum TaxID=2528016 RepID=A0A5C6DZ85_9BACT|nr:prepilin-type cleavage/methylation domain-containing protein [Novipirellula artificiosorum]TWU41902.1 hypothetical protein Poly41_01950 [Novipirellula artificiosorum]